jgi:hypothetical protein
LIVDRRRVDRLSLQVGRAEEAARAAQTIREALRIATMPGDGRPGRLFIRRLDLGTIQLGEGPSPIARRMEAYLRALRLDAVPIADPRAPAAEVVIARDPIEPLAVALAHAAARRRLTAWFWPRVDEQLTAQRAPAEIAAIVWRLLAERRDAVACIPAVVGAVLDADGAAEVLAVIDPVLGQRLVHVMDVTAIPAGVAAEIVETIVPPRWRSVVRQVIAKWTADKRAAWLVTAVVRAAHPRISAARLAALVRGVTAMPVLERKDRPREVSSTTPPDNDLAARRSDITVAPPRPDDLRASASDVEVISSKLPRPIPDAASGVPVDATRPARLPAPPLARAATPDEPARPPESAGAASMRWWLSERPQPTRYGGLYFVLRPLARLGLDAFVAAHPELDELDFGVRVLARIADAQGITAEDPIRIALELAQVESPIRVPVPPAFADLWTERVPAPVPEGLDPLRDLIDAWHAAVSAWLDRHAQLDLTTVVVRDAAVLCSRTHLDVVFDMESSDVRLRKAALDIDPGFVPWLGRVVQFHYVFGGMLDV